MIKFFQGSSSAFKPHGSEHQSVSVGVEAAETNLDDQIGETSFYALLRSFLWCLSGRNGGVAVVGVVEIFLLIFLERWSRTRKKSRDGSGSLELEEQKRKLTGPRKKQLFKQQNPRDPVETKPFAPPCRVPTTNATT